MAMAAARFYLLLLVLASLGHAFRLEPRKAQRAHARLASQTQPSAMGVEADKPESLVAVGGAVAAKGAAALAPEAAEDPGKRAVVPKQTADAERMVQGEPSTASASASASAAAGPAGVAQQPHPDEEYGECPICYEAISAGDAAMRCSGDGGMHHYYHATCLQQWIRQCRSGQSATCPVCRGTVQFNGQRLDTFLQSPSAANLDEEERTFLKSIADGLQHKNAWSDMTNLERGAFSMGIAAAAGWGFMVGYHGDAHAAYANDILVTPHLGRDHNIAQGVGWIAGLLARLIREATREKKRDDDRR